MLLFVLSTISTSAASYDLGLDSGVLIAVPIPSSESAHAAAVEDATQQALREARYMFIVTNSRELYVSVSHPFLLSLSALLILFSAAFLVGLDLMVLLPPFTDAVSSASLVQQ